MAAPSGLRKPVWSPGTEVALIDFFQANACLWDPKDIGYQSRQLREERLLELCQLLNVSAKPGTQFTPKDCKERFKNLRTTFHREYKKKDSATELGRAAGTEVRTPRWVHYARMMFLARAKKPVVTAAPVPKSCDNGGSSEDPSSEGSNAGSGAVAAVRGTSYGTNGQQHADDVNDDDSCGGGDSTGRVVSSLALTEMSPPSPDQRPAAARPMRLAAAALSRKRRKRDERAYSPAQEAPSSATAGAAIGGLYDMSVAARPAPATAGGGPLTSATCCNGVSSGAAAGAAAMGTGCAPAVGGGGSCCCCCALRQSCDSDEAFSRYVCASLKQMAPHVRCLAKLEIQRTLTQFETEASAAAASAAAASDGQRLGSGHGGFYPL